MAKLRLQSSNTPGLVLSASRHDRFKTNVLNAPSSRYILSCNGVPSYFLMCGSNAIGCGGGCRRPVSKRKAFSESGEYQRKMSGDSKKIIPRTARFTLAETETMDAL